MFDKLQNKFSFTVMGNVYFAARCDDSTKFIVSWTHDEGGSTDYDEHVLIKYLSEGTWAIVDPDPVQLLERGDRITMLNDDVYVYSRKSKDEIFFYNPKKLMMGYLIEEYMNKHIKFVHAAPPFISSILDINVKCAVKYERPSIVAINNCQQKLKKLLDDREKLNNLIAETEQELHSFTK